MKKTSTRNETFKILFFCALLFFAYTSAAGQEKISSDSDLAEFDLGVRELETNYVGFPTSVTEQTRDQYEALKARCRQQVAQQGRKPWEALGELYAWFGDFHLRAGGYSQPYMRKVPTYEEMKEYNPTKTFRKVTDHTFLIRFPSCMGQHTRTHRRDSGYRIGLASASGGNHEKVARRVCGHDTQTSRHRL